MVRRAEGPAANERDILGKLVGHRVDLGDVQGFVDRHARQEPRQGARQQGLPRARRAGHQHVVDDAITLVKALFESTNL
jgi:hypothetical protein